MNGISKCLKGLLCVRNYSKQVVSKKTNPDAMKYLNVAEKHDAAKTIAGLLSNGSASRREGYSVYNKIFDFEATVRGSKCKMVMTSVSGHLLQFEFLQSYRNWRNVDPISLFDAPVRKNCPEDYQPIKRTIEREIRSCGGLIIWTDCDREGENIGFEIIEVCRAIKPNITIYRATFSEITSQAVRRALTQLKTPDRRQSEAVDIRSELDLRTGAAITRFQTMRFQRLFPGAIADKLISYGSCQIPTLGFVAERYKEIEAFVSEPFWKIKVTHVIEDLTVEFNWARNRLFDKQECDDYYLLCLAEPRATVEQVTVKPKSKWRPTPMDTIELEKLGSRKLKLSAKETMTIAEKLYTKGIISYPRTETNQFSSEINLRSIVEQQVDHSIWGGFAQRVIEWGPNPRNGNKSDQAHPPIHPTKLVTNLDGNEARVYELICRHFLACVSKDAVGSETIVNINIAGEKFTATGLCIYERNYLDVYIYDKWNAKQIHNYVQGQIFEPTEISMPEGATTPPALLTEADLIALMDKNGIGTDATHAEHINTIKERGYIGVIDKGFLVPGLIGMGLYEGYEAMQLALAKPVLRAEFEADLKRICLGEKDSKQVLQEQIVKYKEAYKQIMERVTAMDEKMGQRVNETPTAVSTNASENGTDRTNGSSGHFENSPNHFQELFKCPKCKIAPMALRPKKNQSGYMIGCLNFPECKNAIWFPTECQDPTVRDENCPKCGEGYKLLKFKFATASLKAYFNAPAGWYKTCLRCDTKFRERFDINLDSVKAVGAIVSNTPPISNTNNATFNTNRVANNRLGHQNGSSIAGSSGTSTTNANRRGNKTTGNAKKPGDKTRTTKKTATKTITTNQKNPTSNSNSNIRNFFTNATQRDNVAPVESSNNDLNEFFDSNDSFDNLIRGAGHQQIVTNEIDDDVAAAFENDDDDWLLTAIPEENLNTNTNVVSTSSSQLQSNINPVFNDMDDSLSEMFRTEIDYNSIPWGTSDRNSAPICEPQTKKPRLHTTEAITRKATQTTTSTTFASTSTRTTEIRSASNPAAYNDAGASSSHNSYENYSWGSSGRVATTSPASNVKCTGCHQPAKGLSVKKDGPNQGRLYYVCSRERPCKFFQWADELSSLGEQNQRAGSEFGSWGTSSQNSRESLPWGTSSQPTAPPSRTKVPQNTNTSSNSNIEVKCPCDAVAISLTVKKDGPNKGRQFHKCSQGKCNFFKWADENNEQASSSHTAQQNRTWGTGGVGDSNSKRAENDNNASGGRETKKRKCGLCRQEGHTKQKCPRKSEYDLLF